MKTNNKIGTVITNVFMLFLVIRMIATPFCDVIDYVNAAFHFFDCTFMFNILLLLSDRFQRQGIRKQPITFLAFLQLFALIISIVNYNMPTDIQFILLFITSGAVFLEVILDFVIGIKLTKVSYTYSVRKMGTGFIVYSTCNLLVYAGEIAFMLILRDMHLWRFVLMFSYAVEIYFLYCIHDYFADTPIFQRESLPIDYDERLE